MKMLIKLPSHPRRSLAARFCFIRQRKINATQKGCSKIMVISGEKLLQFVKRVQIFRNSSNSRPIRPSETSTPIRDEPPNFINHTGKSRPRVSPIKNNPKLLRVLSAPSDIGVTRHPTAASATERSVGAAPRRG